MDFPGLYSLGFAAATGHRSRRSSSGVRHSSTQSGSLGRNAPAASTQSLAARTIAGHPQLRAAEILAIAGSVEAVVARQSAFSVSDGGRRTERIVASVAAATKGFSVGLHCAAAVEGTSESGPRGITPAMAALLEAAEAEDAAISASDLSSPGALAPNPIMREVKCMKRATVTNDPAVGYGQAVPATAAHAAKKPRVPMSALDGNVLTKLEEHIVASLCISNATSKQESNTATNSGVKIAHLTVPVSGRSFIVSFNNGFFETTVIPHSVFNAFQADLMPYVLLSGSTTEPFKVQLKMEGGKCVFSEGWYSFVAAERIVTGDKALFFLRGKNLMDMRLYDANGCEKPMSKRPQNWAPPQAAAQENANANNNAAPAIIAGQAPVPDHVLGMEYELGPRVSISPQLMQFMANIWMFRRHNYPLYAVQLNHSQVHRSIFYFNAQFSDVFPNDVITLKMSLGDRGTSHKGILKKTDGPTRLLKILKCWGSFADEHGLQEGSIYIMKFRLVGHVARLKVYPLPGPAAA